MALGRLISLAVISGIFSRKGEELDILPPPPPFPEIGAKEDRKKEAVKARKLEEKKRQKELELKGKKEEKRKKQEEREKVELKKRKERELREKERRNEEKRKQEEKIRKELAMAKQKEEAEKRKAEEERQIDEGKQKNKDKPRNLAFEKELGKKKSENACGKKASEKEWQMGSGVKDFEPLPKIDLKDIPLPFERPKKKTIFDLILGRKKNEEGEKGFKKELEEIEELYQETEKEKGAKTRLDVPELKLPAMGKFEKKIIKHEEVVDAEEEIKRAIEGMRKAKKKKPIVRDLFKKKEKPVEEKVEIPEIMPRVKERADGVELVEEKIHKARLALMDFKFDEAKRVYIEIMKMYNELEPKKKSKVYQDIKDLYYERKSAEKFGK